MIKLFAAVAALALTVAGPGLAAETDQPDAKRHDKGDTPNPAKKGSEEAARRKVLAQNPPEIRTPNRPDDQESQRNERSLDPAWVAANAASSSAYYAWWMNLIAAAGVVVGFFTLIAAAAAAYFAKRAADESRRGVKAALRNNLVARQMGQAQVRAYPAVSQLTISVDHKDRLTATAKVTNSGSSPAVNVDLVIALTLFTAVGLKQDIIPLFCGGVPVGGQEFGPFKYQNREICGADFANATACHAEVAVFCKDVFNVEKTYFHMFGRRGAPQGSYIFDEGYILPVPAGFDATRIGQLKSHRAA